MGTKFRMIVKKSVPGDLVNGEIPKPEQAFAPSLEKALEWARLMASRDPNSRVEVWMCKEHLIWTVTQSEEIQSV